MDVFNVKENKYRVANRHSRTLPRNSRVDNDGKMAKRVSPIRRHFVKRDNAVECSSTNICPGSGWKHFKFSKAFAGASSTRMVVFD